MSSNSLFNFGNSVVTIVSTLESVSSSVGSLVISGGVGIAKTLYVGTNIFLAGNAVSTQSYVQGLLSSYQPLTSGTSISALTLALTGTLDSTSTSSGSLITSGGLGIAKSLCVGTNIFLAGNAVATQAYVTSLGYLTSASAAATYLTQLSAASIYQPLTSGTSISALTLTLTGTTDSTSISSGSLITAGGLAIAKSLYVGTNIFLAGNAVATQAYVTGLGYLTSAFASTTYLTQSSAAAVYQPLTANTAVSALTLNLTGTTDSTSASSGALTTTGGLSVSKNIFVGSALTSFFYNSGSSPAWYIIGLYDASAVGSSTVGCRSEIKILTGSGFNTGVNYGGCVTIQLTSNNNSVGTSANVSGTYFTTGDSSISVLNISFVQNGTNRFSYFIYANFSYLSSHTIHAKVSPGVIWTSSMTATTNPGANSATVSIAVQTFSATNTGLVVYSTSDAINSASGSLATFGGLGVAKSLYVGTNIFLAGSAVATQSFVTGLGYLTSASAATIYQPLSAGTAISALTLALTGTTDSSSISTGSLVTAGGLGIAKTLYVGTNIFLAGSAVATQSFVTGLGYLTSTSAAAIYQPLTAGTAISALTLSLTGTSDSTSISTGSLVTAGGLGIAKSLYVGTNIFLSGSAVATQSFVTGLGYLTSASAAATYLTLSSASATYLTISNATATYQPLTSGTSISALTLALTGTTDSASISTGSFVTAGGLGIAKSLYVGTNIFLSGSAVATQSFVTGLGYLTSASAAATYLTLSSASATYLTINNATATYQPLTSGTSISALTLALTGTTDSASISTGSFVTAGGLGIAKSLYVGTNIFLAGSAVATQSFVTGLGYLTSASAAATYLTLSSASATYLTISNATATYQPLTAGTAVSALTLALTGTTDSTSISTGSLVSAGGLGIAKTLYVGTNIFLAGSAVATQSFVTGLGYLTITSAAAIYQPLTAGTAVSALTLSVTGTTDSTSISTGSLVSAGGFGIAKTLYVGSNIFLAGSAVATQSYVTGLGYLTTTSAAAIYQPLTAGTAVSALTLSVTGTTDSTSISTGSLVTAGGLGIAKTLYVGTNIFLAGSAVATQSFVTGLGYLTSTSAAATYLTLSSASATYLTISNATATYQPLTSGTSISALTLALTGTTDSASISTGSFVTAGGLAIAKSLYVGTNIFLAGSAVATQTFVTGLGYLTSTSAAATYLTLSSASATYLTISNATATYQPLTSGTSISALTLALTGTTDSASISTGSFVTAGGLAIAKSLYVGTNIFLAGSAVATQSFVTGLGYLTSASAAATYLTLSSASATYLTISNATATYQPLTAGTAVSALTLALTGTTDSTSISTGSLVSAGGLGIAKTLYVGTNIFLAGSAVATQSFVTGLGYLTTTSAAAIYQPLTAGTAVSALTLSVTGTTDSTSISTGSLVSAGGLGIAKTLYVGSNIFLAGSAVATQSFVTGLGYLTTTSAAAIYQPLTAGTAVSALTLSVTGTTDSTSISTGSLVSAGGLGIAKTLYVGTNIFLAGSAVATQSFVTGLGYLTTTSAAAVYQPLISGTSINALTLILTSTADSTSASTGSLTTLGGLGIAKSLYVAGGGVSALGYVAKIIGNLYVGDPTTGTSVDNIVLGADANTLNGVDLRLGFVKKSGTYPRISSGSAIPVTVSISSSTGIQAPGTSTFTDIGSFALTGLNIIPSTSFVGTSNTSVSSNSASLTINGDIHFYNSTGAIVYGNLQGQSPPSVTTRSTGTRMVFYPSLGPSTVDYAMGIASNQQWYSVATGGSHVFYINTVSIFSISSATVAVGVGLLVLGGTSITNTIDASNSTNGGSLTVSGGTAIAKSLYVGGLASIGSTLNMNSNKILNLATPTLSTDAANKGYVDSVAQGLSAKNSVVLASTAPLTLSTGFSAGSVVDGITLTVGMRILIKDQSSLTENGIYLVTATAPTRTTDFPTGSEQSGAYFFVESGTINADYGFVCVSIAPNDVVGTSISFSQFSGAGQITAGTGLTKSGNTLSINASQTQITQLGTLLSLSVSGLVTLTGIADAISSINGGAVTISGGLAVGKSLYSGTNIYMTGSLVATQSYVTGLGYLTITSAAATYLTISNAAATYLTISNAAAIYQPLTAGTAVSALSLSLTGTADSTSVATGSFVTAGGAGIAKSLYVGTNMYMTGSLVATQSYVTGLGYLTITSAAATYLTISNAATTYLTISNAATTYLTISNAAAIYQPLTAGTAVSALSLSLTGTADSTSVATGSFVTSGGAGIAKSLYVGTNMYMTGSLVATQSYVTGLGYLTITSAAATYLTISNAATTYLTISNAATTYLTISNAAAIYQPLTAGTAVSALSLSLTGTADSTSVATGSFVTAGGAGIAKSLYVGTNMYMTGSLVATQSYVTGLGYLTITSATATYLTISNAAATYLTISNAAAIYQPLTAGTAVSALSLSLTGTADSTSVATGSFVTAGGAGIAKSLYVGTNMYMTGSLVATQSYVTGLGYLTTTSAAATYLTISNAAATYLTINNAAAIYQPLTAGTAVSALSLSLTGTADSTSVATGSFVTAGGAGIAKSLYVGTNMYMTGSLVATQSYVTGLGYLTITSAAATYLTISNAAATYLTISNAAATYLTISNAATTYLTISNAATTYLTISNAAAIYQPLTAGTAVSALSLSLTGTADSTSVATGSFVTAGGAGIAKSLYVGTNMYMTGSLVATQSYVTGLGYLTITSATATYLTISNAAATYLTISNAAAIYQPLTAGTAVSALSLSLTGTADSTSVATGSFVTAGGAGIAKSLYVGTNMYMTGSLVATQSYVTGLGYLTITSATATYLTISNAAATYLTISNAAAIYQPLTAGTAVSALSLSLTGTADSTSVATGSFVTAGGAGIAKSLYVGTNMYMTGSLVATQSYVTGLGYLTTTSAAATYLTISNAAATYLTINNAAAIYQPLTAGTAVSALSLSLTGTADSTSVATGSFVTAGGAGIAKSLYVGTNMYMTGSLVATQSYVTGLGYLTITSAAATYLTISNAAATYLTISNAAAIYQPLTAGTAVSALSLSLTGTADSTSVTTGSFVTAGGAGVSKNLSVGSKVQFFGTNSQYVALRAPASPANISLTLPASLPSVANSYLVSDTSGILSFSTSGGTGSSTPTSYSFSGANSQTTPANVTAMVYSSGNFELNVSVNISATTNLTQLFLISAVLSGGASLWNINAISVTGDNSGVIFSITSAGQVQYTSSTYPGFIALTINWSTFISVTGGSNLISGTNSSGTPSATSGALFYVAPSTFTDINTAASGTVSNFAGTYIGAPTLSASNTSITTTSASTFYISGPPVAGTNETITNSYSLQVASGNVLLSGTVDAINSTSGGTLNTSGGVVIGKQLYAQQHKTISGTVAIPSAGTYYISFGMSGFIGKVSAYITSITNGIWASQGTILMPPGNLRANLSNVTAYQYNSGAGSQIAASLQPFAGTNSNAPATDSPSNSVQVVVTTITSASTLVWSLIVFQNWI